VEIKTRSGLQTKYRAALVSAKHGEYFEAEVGSEEWFDAVPRANRGHVLAQAVVLDADYVLFTESVAGRRLYSVLVHVTQAQREIFAGSIDKWKDLVVWARKDLEIDGPPPEVPPAFSTRSRRVLRTHLRLYRAVMKLIKNQFEEHQWPLPPVRLFKSLVQVFYNKMKGGIDGNTQYVKAISGHAKREFALNLETKIILRSVKHLVVNTAIAHRIIGMELHSRPVDGAAAWIKQKVSRGDPMVKKALQLSCELADHAFRLQKNPQLDILGDDDPAEGHAERYATVSSEDLLTYRQHKILKDKLSVEKQREWYSQDDLARKIRFNFKSEPAEHMLKVNNRKCKECPANSSSCDHKLTPLQRCCIMCADGTPAKICSRCEVPLCSKPRAYDRRGTASCHVRFHELQTLELTTGALEKLKIKAEKKRLLNNKENAIAKRKEYSAKKRRLKDANAAGTPVPGTPGAGEELAVV
jgi:hypothetical protein